MKIAFLTRNYPPDSLWGGDAVVYHNLARGLAERGHEVHVICQATGEAAEYVQGGVFTAQGIDRGCPVNGPSS